MSAVSPVIEWTTRDVLAGHAPFSARPAKDHDVVVFITALIVGRMSRFDVAQSETAGSIWPGYLMNVGTR